MRPTKPARASRGRRPGIRLRRGVAHLQHCARQSEVARRFAVPPQSSARDAEQHGKLDASGKVNDATFNLLANLKDLDAKDPNAALCEEILPMKGPLDPHPVMKALASSAGAKRLKSSVFPWFHSTAASGTLPTEQVNEIRAIREANKCAPNHRRDWAIDEKEGFPKVIRYPSTQRAGDEQADAESRHNIA